jgi:DNA-binding PadR family transcriptional regulator
MHVYQMHDLIRRRGKDKVVNVAQRNSVYQTIERLLRVQLVRVQQTFQDEGRPERVVYGITDQGSATLARWLKEMLEGPSNEFPEFPAALATLPALSVKEVREQLELRIAAMNVQLSVADLDEAGTKHGTS